MGKKQKNGSRGNHNGKLVQGTTLREEETGKKQVQLSSILKVEHLQKVATWACLEAKIPSLGAFYGRQLAATAEAEGIPLDPSIFLCERCESILEPGNNCTMRIEKNAKKTKRSKKSRISSQNNLLYKCHFCSHPNLMRGTPKGYVKELLAQTQRSKLDSHPTLECPNKVLTSSIKKCPSDKDEEMENCKHVETAERHIDVEPITLLERLAHSSKKKRKIKATRDKTLNSGTSPVQLISGEGTLGSSRKKRKGWSSLKEIAGNNEAGSSRSISNFAIPFVLNIAK